MEKASRHCRTLLLGDAPSDKDEFGQHAKIARAIIDMVNEEEAGRTVGLFGSWGSGKSTIIQVLKNLSAHDKTEHVFVFDAWAHQGDPLRRAFLEQQISSLCAGLWLRSEDWRQTLDGLARRLKVRTTKEVPQLTIGGIILLVTAAVAPFGLALLSGTQVPPRDALMWWGVALSALLPLAVLIRPFLPFLNKVPSARGGRWDFLSLFVSRSETTIRTETSETPDPTSLEFNGIFIRVLRAALADKQRRLVIVVDNLDRIPTSDALSIWSTMRTFFECANDEDKELVKRLWLIVPYDKRAAERLWPNDQDGNGEHGSELATSFVQKTFQVSFHVPPPVVSDLEKYFLERLASVVSQKFVA